MVKYNTEMWMYRRWERVDDARYYAVYIEQDLTGEWILRRIWGGINKSTGSALITPCSDRLNAIALLENVAKTRRSHRYTEVNNIN